MSVNAVNIRETLLALLTETFGSGDNPEGTMYLDRGAGLFDSVASLSAAQASRKIIPGGTTIAAQVNHSLYYLEVLERYMQGETPKTDWSESWHLQTVDETTWQALKEKLDETYRRISATLQTQDDWDKLEDGFAIAIHTAYHLGAIRQMLKLLGGENSA